MAMNGLRVLLSDRSDQVVADALAWIADIASAPPETTATQERTAQQSDDGAWKANVRAAPPLDYLADDVANDFEKDDQSEGMPGDWRSIDLVLECVPEQISLKKRVLRRLSSLFPPPTLIASNSSYFTPSVLEGFVTDPTRFAHMHFHVPVLHDSVCDIVGCAATYPAVIERLRVLSRRIGQYPLVLRHEHPGYVFNWLLQSVLRSALELSVLDVADPEEIDRSWKSVTGMPLGPFGMMDQIGLDVIEQVLSNARWGEPPEVSDAQLLDVLKPLIAQGHFGVKTGKGFYQYAEDHVQNQSPPTSQ